MRDNASFITAHREPSLRGAVPLELVNGYGAALPAAGHRGYLFGLTAGTPGIYLDDGTTWQLIADLGGSGGGTPADHSITYVKIQNVVGNNVVLGRVSGAGGIVEELTAADLRTLLDLDESDLEPFLLMGA